MSGGNLSLCLRMLEHAESQRACHYYPSPPGFKQWIVSSLGTGGQTSRKQLIAKAFCSSDKRLKRTAAANGKHGGRSGSPMGKFLISRISRAIDDYCCHSAIPRCPLSALPDIFKNNPVFNAFFGFYFLPESAFQAGVFSTRSVFTRTWPDPWIMDTAPKCSIRGERSEKTHKNCFGAA